MEWNEFNGICSFCAACVAPRSVLRVLHLGKILPLGSWQSAPLVLDNEGLWICELSIMGEGSKKSLWALGSV